MVHLLSVLLKSLVKYSRFVRRVLFQLLLGECMACGASLMSLVYSIMFTSLYNS